MILRHSRRLLAMEGERKFTFPSTPATLSTGGVPFYGNIYAGRVDTQNYVPPPQEGSGLIKPNSSAWDDPQVRSKIERCPYFALCDQVVWHNMDPAYLDPGLLTMEEHQLLLLFSRAYYEKWKLIHKRPPNALPRVRIKYGSTVLLEEMLELIDVPVPVRRALVREFQVDDASLIAMDPDCWSAAYLDPFNRDHFSGRVLEFADMSEAHREKFYLLLRQMRRIVVVRRDTPEEERLVLPFSSGITLYDLSKYLGIEPYGGQLKVYDYVDLQKTQQVITLKDEDSYFDYLVTTFFKANLRNATLSDVADDMDNTARYTITVEPFTVAEKRIGRWF
ncbi:hypothetical protein, conserved [Trypanosoma brucei gambiense DAL972]|uniref:Uncharacterized protein n=1 Tax=Trypanosoma brucei gambiense (strain MHOM/CI/86/DAL972) TaxID=679716 RepID=C9ZML5_TRYB9|nr:hypothetical protein, conserved [Trypanosoma brucei gambiense DAL972]CBH10518.1 hypothetical protein, conserved [Trypanosoma brucei gambiense DAL972]|eukprot:XP_011772807.1 hypothetical protein, conserved [Trypanosoma brucei gambiense DAL972]